MAMLWTPLTVDIWRLFSSSYFWRTWIVLSRAFSHGWWNEAKHIMLSPCLQTRSQRTAQGTQGGTASYERAIHGLKGVCGVREGSFAYFALVFWGSSCGQVAYESWSLLKTKQRKAGWHHVLWLATSETLTIVFVCSEPPPGLGSGLNFLIHHTNKTLVEDVTWKL